MRQIPQEGLRFECQQSGRCCAAYGSEGYVILTESTQDVFQEGYKGPPTEFCEKFANHIERFKDEYGKENQLQQNKDSEL